MAGRQGWVDGQMILAVALLNVIGYEHVSDVDTLEEDASLCRRVRDYEEEMLGLPADVLARRFRGGRGRTFPSANAVHDWLLRFQDEAAGQPRKKGTAVVPKPAAEMQVIAAGSRRLAGRLIQALQLDELTLDMDATVLASGKKVQTAEEMLTRAQVQRYAVESGLRDMMIAEKEVVLTYLLDLLAEDGTLEKLPFSGM